ncbi:MAG: hypothetical protein ACI8TQ_000460 [Planctomycetota bacterium]|jgi:hypothetical protein
MGRRQLLLNWWQLAPFLFLVIASACRSQSESAGNSPIEPRFLNSLRLLGAAVEAGEDESAQRILNGILGRAPEGHTLEIVEGFQEVLEGRFVAKQIAFNLIEEDAPSSLSSDNGGSYLLTLQVTNRGSTPVQIFLPPPTLHHLDHQIFLSGSETKSMDSRIIDGLDGLSLLIGETVRIELGEYSAVTAKALARRERWKVKMLSGEFEVDGRRLPFSAPSVHFCEVVLLADYLSDEPIAPQALLDYVQAQSINMPALLERCVRIPPSRWTETLESLAPIVQAMDDQRVTDIAPVLRWLSRSGLIGGDARTWRFALSQIKGEAQQSRPALDLPDPF